MRPLYKSLNIPTPIAAGPGTSLLVDRFRDKVVQLSGTTWSAGNVIVEGSQDNVNWSPINGAGTASPGGFVDIPYAVQYVRITLGAGITAAALSAIFGGFDSRSE